MDAHLKYGQKPEQTFNGSKQAVLFDKMYFFNRNKIMDNYGRNIISHWVIEMGHKYISYFYFILAFK
jgi:hypothetical protein